MQAPEVIDAFRGDSVYSKRCDIWSLGVIVFVPYDVTNLPYDVTNLPYDVTNLPYDVTNLPYDVTNLPYDVTNLPYDVTNLPYDVTNLPYDVAPIATCTYRVSISCVFSVCLYTYICYIYIYDLHW